MPVGISLFSVFMVVGVAVLDLQLSHAWMPASRASLTVLKVPA